LIENNKFASIVNKFSSRYKKIRENTSFKWIVRTPVNYDSRRKYPVLFALHQGDGNIEETEKIWDMVLKHDVLLALPQSSEITGENTYTWMDIDNGLVELNEIYSQIRAEYNIDLNNVFLSGFSIGGNLALEASFVRPKFPVRGCITVNPSLIQPDPISKNFAKAREEGIKCCIVVGTRDPEYEKIKKLISLLDHENIKNRIYEIKDLGHAFPDNFNELLGEMITYLLINSI
jgi:predicted esterase